MKTFAEVIDYLYDRLPMFTRDGAKAIRPDLKRTLLFCAALGDPHKRFATIHVAGTNGKGSSSHMLASILASAGYRTGLYTSPHLIDFRERIRIDGEMITQNQVVEFVNRHRELIEELKPSFFEVTVCMAFDYFAREQVDMAVIEVGLGGRLDSTNIIVPEVSLITNIGLDHMDLLGSTITQIAAEKAGIIKPAVPVVISERQEETTEVFGRIAAELDSPIYFAEDAYQVTKAKRIPQGLRISTRHSANNLSKEWTLDLTGMYQRRNLLGVLMVIDQMRDKGYKINDAQINKGLAQVLDHTGLLGRWQTIETDPWTICDTGHNEDGIRSVLQNLESLVFNRLHVVIGAMKDKDLAHILSLLPKKARYYFAAPKMPRAIPAEELLVMAHGLGLRGEAYSSVVTAHQIAKESYLPGDLIFVGGSTFVVAEVLINRSL
ncbi:MAG: bifunctional folylpolyglutamate synthase/dihydrofolate synthase [Sphingobacterium sp.]